MVWPRAKEGEDATKMLNREIKECRGPRKDRLYLHKTREDMMEYKMTEDI